MSVSVLNVAHCNVNCRSIERSLAFYRDVFGLVVGAHTAPADPQDCSAFGMSGMGQWDAYMMMDPARPGGTVLDLLEWRTPLPVGAPYAVQNHLGFARLALGVPDVQVMVGEVEAAGGSVLTPPVALEVAEGEGESVRFALVVDPDGTVFELVERPASTPRLMHVNINCRDASRSIEWYQRVLGFEVAREWPSRPWAGELFGLSGGVEIGGALLQLPGSDDGFGIDLLEWKQPPPTGVPYLEPNHLGIFRMALLVEDAQAAYEILREEGVECPPPVWLDMGSEIPVDGLWAVFFPDPDGTCLEFIQVPEGIGSE